VASISKAPNGHRTIQFIGGDGKRRSVRLGKVPHRQAEAVKLRVEALNAAAISICPLDGDTATWVATIGDDLAAKLAAVGLIAERASANLGDFLAAYITRRTDIKPRTRINLEACQARLVEFFGKDRSLKTITPGDADAWLLWLRERYANGTAGRTVKRAKQFFRSAVRSRLIPNNPFEDVKPPSQVNDSRKHFVSRETMGRILEACPDTEWRLIVALCRFGGVRCPSELLPLRWAEVNWAQGRFLVHSPKTEHHEGGADRWVPIFPELRPYLADAFERAEPGAVYLINRYRDVNVNLRTQLLRIIRRAGVTPWPKLFQNLRATRETELAAEYPLHVVCAWIGNSALVAQKHYLQVTDADFERASGEPGAKSGAEAVQKAVQSANDGDCQESPETPQAPEKAGLVQILTSVVHYLQCASGPPRGLEPRSSGCLPAGGGRQTDARALHFARPLAVSQAIEEILFLSVDVEPQE
jgi:integrase